MEKRFTSLVGQRRLCQVLMDLKVPLAGCKWNYISFPNAEVPGSNPGGLHRP